MQTAPNQMIELAVLPPADRAVAAINAQAAEKHLRALVEKSAEIQNVVDKNGRDEAHRAAMGLKNARVAVVNTGKAAREDATAFQRAVVAEVERLAAITADEEARLFGLRDAFDDRVAEEKARAERIEAERKAKHRERIDSILTLPARHVGDSASALTQVLEVLARRDVTAEGFEEFTEEAAAAINTAAASLIEMQKTAADREEAARLERVRQEAAARQAAADRAEVERLKAAAAEAEAQRLREEQERREELERSTRAQAEAMAAQKRQQEHMAEIKRVQGLGLTISDARGVDAALQSVRAFDPSTFGEMEPMANMARDLALSSLEQRFARVLELELPGAMDDARKLDLMFENQKMVNEILGQAESTPNLVPIHDINWDEPAPLAPTKHYSGLTIAPPPAPQAPDDSPAVNAFRAAVAELRNTRSDAEIRVMLEDELGAMAARG